METIFMNMENSKTNEPHKFFLNLSQGLDLRSSDEHVPLQNLSIYCKWEIMRKQYKNNKFKIIVQHGMMNLNYQMVLILFQIFKNLLSASLKSIKH